MKKQLYQPNIGIWASKAIQIYQWFCSRMTIYGWNQKLRANVEWIYSLLFDNRIIGLAYGVSMALGTTYCGISRRRRYRSISNTRDPCSDGALWSSSQGHGLWSWSAQELPGEPGQWNKLADRCWCPALIRSVSFEDTLGSNRTRCRWRIEHQRTYRSIWIGCPLIFRCLLTIPDCESIYQLSSQTELQAQNLWT